MVSGSFSATDIPLSGEARDTFVEEMIPCVKYLAHRAAVGLPPSVDISDLINYGVIGLMDAMEKYNPQKGVKFKTYAETRIRGAMLDGMRAEDYLSRHARRKKRGLERAYKTVEQGIGRPATDVEIARHMGISIDELGDLLKGVKGASLVGLEEVFEGDGAIKYARLRTNGDSDPYVLVQREQLRHVVAGAVSKLPEREQKVCGLYYCDELSMKEIGQILGVSESRVSQLHKKALLRVRAALENKFDERHEAAA